MKNFGSRLKLLEFRVDPPKDSTIIVDKINNEITINRETTKCESGEKLKSKVDEIKNEHKGKLLVVELKKFTTESYDEMFR